MDADASSPCSTVCNYKIYICSHMNSRYGHEAGDIVQLILKEFFLSASYLHEMAMFTLQK